MVGTDAELVTNPKEPTMVLSLRGYHKELQRSLVIHEFGHTLGLEHEHQRSDFWDIVGDYFDITKMMMEVPSPKSLKDARVGFEKDWLRKISNPRDPLLSEYDPDSIMHYL